MNKLFLDTYALVELTRNGPKSGKVLLEIKKSPHILCSTLNLYELWYILAASDGENIADAAVLSIKNLAKAIAPDEEICIIAAKLKNELSGIGVVDLISAATAIQNDAIVLTGDPHFKSFKNVKTAML